MKGQARALRVLLDNLPLVEIPPASRVARAHSAVQLVCRRAHLVLEALTKALLVPTTAQANAVQGTILLKGQQIALHVNHAVRGSIDQGRLSVRIVPTTFTAKSVLAVVLSAPIVRSVTVQNGECRLVLLLSWQR